MCFTAEHIALSINIGVLLIKKERIGNFGIVGRQL
jgi:hypothetical protein